MKIRLDYVTNSSSSSYTCIVCGNTESGMDMCLSDADMTECENGHVFCNDHLLKNNADSKTRLINHFNQKISNYEGYKITYPNKASQYDGWIQGVKDNLAELETLDEDEMEDWIRDEDLGVSPEQCPICQFERLATKDIADYLMKKHNIDLNSLKEEMKQTFNNYDEFKNYLK